MAPACALLGGIAGNLLSVCGFYALLESVPCLQMVRAVFSHPATMLELLKATFSPMDLLFYALALYAGYRCALRPVSKEELAASSRH